jgi:hypothetical protein
MNFLDIFKSKSQSGKYYIDPADFNKHIEEITKSTNNELLSQEIEHLKLNSSEKFLVEQYLTSEENHSILRAKAGERFDQGHFDKAFKNAVKQDKVKIDSVATHEYRHACLQIQRNIQDLTSIVLTSNEAYSLWNWFSIEHKHQTSFWGSGRQLLEPEGVVKILATFIIMFLGD